MIKKYENFGNFFKPNKLNIINFVNNKISSKNESFNKNISNKNKSKNKYKEKKKKNLFKTINLLPQNKKYYKNIKQPILIKNNKNEINIRLNLNCALLNNINNINNIQKYNNIFNNQIYTYNCLNNSSSFEDLIKEKDKSAKKESVKKGQKLNSKNNKKRKNLSQINLTNLTNNKCKIGNSMPKTRSTENINISKKNYNKRFNSEKNFNNLINKINLLYENNFTNIMKIFSNNTKTKKNTKNIRVWNINLQNKAKNSQKNIKSNYNYYNINCKNNKKNNKKTKSYENKNIYKNSDIFLSAFKNRNYKTPRPCKNNFNHIINNKKYKNESFNLRLFDEIFNKTKNTFEKCKNMIEMKLKNKT